MPAHLPDKTGKRLRGPERGAARKRGLSARAQVDLARGIEMEGHSRSAKA